MKQIHKNSKTKFTIIIFSLFTLLCSVYSYAAHDNILVNEVMYVNKHKPGYPQEDSIRLNIIAELYKLNDIDQPIYVTYNINVANSAHSEMGHHSDTHQNVFDYPIKAIQYIAYRKNTETGHDEVVCTSQKQMFDKSFAVRVVATSVIIDKKLDCSLIVENR